MKVENVNKRVQEIDDVSQADSEKASTLELGLLRDVLDSVATCSTDDHHKELARAALKTLHINFPRY